MKKIKIKGKIKRYQYTFNPKTAYIENCTRYQKRIRVFLIFFTFGKSEQRINRVIQPLK